MEFLTPEVIAAGLGAVLVLARIAVKFTKTPKDDAVVQRISESLKRFVG